MPGTQESKNAEEITKLRDYFLQRLDKLQELVQDGVTRDELAKELDRVHQEIAGNHTELSGQIITIKGDIKEVLDEMKVMKREITDKQKEDRNRIIGAQAAALLIILSTVAGLFAQFLFHH
jgi:hypothetical protein